jgi:tRNA (guanine37-N1)-methyltransferase
MVLAVLVPSNLAERMRIWLRKKELLSDTHLLRKTDDGRRVVIPVKRKFRLVGDVPLQFANVKLPQKCQRKEVKLPYDLIGNVCIFKDGAKGIKYSNEAKKIVKLYGFVRTVYLKYGGVEGVERVPKLKLICGTDDPVTLHRENGLRFLVDVKRTYFNPRLSFERLELANSVKKGEKVLDMFAGVGPFSITIAKLAGAYVDAVDINKHAFELLLRNIQINKVSTLVKGYNMDASKYTNKAAYDRIIMNLPFNSLNYISTALQSCKNNAVIHMYLAQRSSDDDLLQVMETKFRQCYTKYIIEKQRRVFDYSPRRAIIRFDIKLV